MSSIDKTPSGRWKARWRVADGSQRFKTFDKKFDAQQFLKAVDRDVMFGVHIDHQRGNIDFVEYAEEWRRMQQHRPSTRESVYSSLRNHVYPHFSGRQLNSIRTSEFQSWVVGLNDELSPNTVRKIAGHLSAIFRSAKADRLIVESPTEAVRLPKTESRLITPLSLGEVDAIAEAIDPKYRALVHLMAGSGLRPGEAFGLSQDRVNWLRKEILVDRQIATTEGSTSFRPLKTASSNRVVPITVRVRDELTAHLEEFGTGDHDLLFCSPNWTAIRRNRFGEVWRRTVKALPFECSGPHQLRHHYASVVIAHGCSVKIVQSCLGHATASETLDTYSHLWPNSQDETRRALEAARSELTGTGANEAVC